MYEKYVYFSKSKAIVNWIHNRQKLIRRSILILIYFNAPLSISTFQVDMHHRYMEHPIGYTIGRSWRMLNINCTSRCIAAADALETNFSSENIYYKRRSLKSIFLKWKYITTREEFWKRYLKWEYILRQVGKFDKRFLNKRRKGCILHAGSRKKVQQLTQRHVTLFQIINIYK